MQLINLETKQVITQSEFKGLFPNTSLPSNINYLDYGYAVVFPAPQPEHNQVIECCKETTPVLTSKGTWEQQWEIQKRFQEYTDEEGVVHTVEEQEQEALAKDAEVKAKVLSESIVQQVQLRLDNFAKTKNYDGILSACTYATSVNPKFKAEGQYCVEARDNTWGTLYQILGEVQAGTRPVPSGYQDIEPELPTLSWPE